MSPSDAGKVQGRLRRVRFKVISVLVVAVIVVGVLVQRGCSPRALEVKELRRTLNWRIPSGTHGSYEWYSPTNIFVFLGRDENTKAYSLNVETGVRSDLDWVLPQIANKDSIIDDWAISWPLHRLSVFSYIGLDHRWRRIYSFDLEKQTEAHVDIEHGYSNYLYLPWQDSWVTMFWENNKSFLKFHTSQKGVVEIKPSPVDVGFILGRSEKLIFVVQRYSGGIAGPLACRPLEIDALMLGDTITLVKHFTVVLPEFVDVVDARLSPDGKWMLLYGGIDSSTMGFTDKPPFVVWHRRAGFLFWAVNLETSSIIKILKKRLNPPYGDTHAPRWLPDGKSVSIIVDGELRVWKLFD